MSVPCLRFLLGLLMIGGFTAQAGPSIPSQNILGDLPLSFEANSGQFDPGVLFGARAFGYQVLARAGGADLLVFKDRSGPDQIRLVLDGAENTAKIRKEERLPGTVSYFLGNDPEKWRTHIATYRRIRYVSVYPGVDLVLYGAGGRLEFDFEVAPGADPSVIAYRFEGVDQISLEDDGGTHLKLGSVMLRQEPPETYQLADNGRNSVQSAFVLEEDGLIRFSVGAYDRSQPLVIDPVLLVYSSFLGGTSSVSGFGGSDQIRDIAVDSNGDAYVAGITNSTTGLATIAAYDTECGTAPNCNNFSPSGGHLDAFVAKVSADGSTLLYATYLGGSSRNGEQANGIDLDQSGNAYVVGTADATDFPTTNGTAFGSCVPGYNGFVTKLNSTGTGLIYSACISAPNQNGIANEKNIDVAVDPFGNAYVLGETTSGGVPPGTFPVSTGAYQPSCGTPDPKVVGGVGCSIDVFVVKLTPGGSSVAYATLLGGSATEWARAIDVDAAGSAYVLGQTLSPQTYTGNRVGRPFPTTPGVIEETCGEIFSVPPVACPGDFFLSKLNVDASSLVYSTHLGVRGWVYAGGVAVDATGHAVVVGPVSSGLATTADAFDTDNPSGGQVGFVMKLNADASSRLYSSYFGKSPGGFNNPTPASVGVSGKGGLWFGGGVSNGGAVPLTADAFPLGGGISGAPGGGYLSKLNPLGNGSGDLEFSTLLGAKSGYATYVSAVAVGCDDSAYAAGSTIAPTMPMTADSFQPTYAGSQDGFILRVKDGPLVTFDSNLHPIQFTVANVKPGCNTGCEAGTYTTPKTLHWSSGAKCEVSFASTQNVSANTRDVFVDWADGWTDSPRAFDPPAADTTYTLNFVRQHRLTTNVVPPPGGSVAVSPTSGDGFYNQGTVVQLTPTANGGYLFSHWSGAVGGSAIPRSVTMSAPRNVTGNFQCVYTVTDSSGGPLPSDIEASGGAFQVKVQTGVGCSWTATEGLNWVSLSGGSSGIGNGSFSFTVEPNAGLARSGSILLANVQIQLSQAGAGSSPSKLGAYTGGSWFVDRNGNFLFEGGEQLGWGSPGDIPVEGDWNGDGFRDLGVFSNGNWFIDANGDTAFNPATDQKGWGAAGWIPVTGDWNGDGITDLGAVDPVTMTWFLDLNGDFAFQAASEIRGWGSPGDTPVVGDWNGDGKDDVGVFSGGTWFIDFNGDGGFQIGTDQRGWGVDGWIPVVGDWDGDGADELGAIDPATMTWFRDVNGDFAFNPATEILGWGSPGNVPVVADWNGDGQDDVGVFADGTWFIDANGDGGFQPATDQKGWGVAGWTPVPGVWQ